MLYSAFTYYCGFAVNSGEYKLMGLAPYGEPTYVDTILRELVDLKPDGSFRLDMSYFDYCHGATMTSTKLGRLLGGPPRRPNEPITERHLDVAASIQRVLEEIMLRMARHVHARTGMQRLCLAGGVALNCVGNGRILREGPFEDVWIQPAAGDAGGALGGRSSFGISCSISRATRGPAIVNTDRCSALSSATRKRTMRWGVTARSSSWKMTTRCASGWPGSLPPAS